MVEPLLQDPLVPTLLPVTVQTLPPAAEVTVRPVDMLMPTQAGRFEAPAIQSSVMPGGRLPLMLKVCAVIVPPPVKTGEGEVLVRQKFVFGIGWPLGTIP